MDLAEKIKSFNKRWNIEENIGPVEKFSKFKNSILDIFLDIDRYIDKENIGLFCRALGIREYWRSVGIDSIIGKNIINSLEGEDNFEKFIRLLEIIFSLDIRGLRGYRGELIFSREKLIKKMKEAVYFSGVDIEISVNKNNDVIFYRKGEELLDKELVNKVLSFLDDKSNKHFEDALKFYQNKEYVQSAEELRRSLEEFLRFKLKNNNNLKVNFDNIGKELKSGVDVKIRNIISQIMIYLDDYFNENSKHKDGNLDENDNEFLIYQSALIMKYVNEVIK